MKAPLKNKSFAIILSITVFVINELITITSAQKCQCGKLQVNPRLKRIHLGHDVPEGSIPWQIYLRILTFKEFGGIECKTYGGALISKKHIVTCAKCMKNFYEQ